MIRRLPSGFLAGLLAAVAVLSLTACQGRKSDAGAPPKELRLAVIPMGTTHEFWKSIHAGARTAAGVDAIFTPNESTTFGCLRALENRGLAGQVIHVGFDSSKKLIEALEKKKLRGLVLQDPFRMGYDGVKTAVAHLRGEPYERSIDTGVVLATPDNMNEPAIRKLLAPDLSILNR